MKLTRPVALAAILALATITAAQDKSKDKDPELPLEKQISLIKSAQDSLVIVQYHLQYDKGEPPAASGFGDGHTDAIEDEPFDSVISDTTRMEYGNSSFVGRTATRARLARRPWPISRRLGLPTRPVSPVEYGGML